MTGFGNYTHKENNQTYIVEIRSINSKLFDFTAKIPSEFRDKENEIRKLVSILLERGKIECVITIEKENISLSTYSIKSDVVKKHYKDLISIAKDLSLSVSDTELLSLAMHIPDVIEPTKTKSTEKEWDILQQTIQEACHLTNTCRENEGGILAADFELHIQHILNYLNDIEPFEDERICSIKTRLHKSLKEICIQDSDFDNNRFEQELIFYLEKIDFTEEKVRLVKHCDYFLNTMKENTANGKKLSFICQEIGREINTLGSKSLEATIQQKVVQMKDELEKIKEQLANIL